MLLVFYTIPTTAHAPQQTRQFTLVPHIPSGEGEREKLLTAYRFRSVSLMGGNSLWAQK